MPDANQKPGAPNEVLVQVVCAGCASPRRAFRYHLQRSCIVACNDCGFCYVNPRLSSDGLRDKLQEWAQKDVVDQERLRVAFDDNTLKLYGSYLAWIEALTKTGGRALLDIGCSVGAFLKVAKARGWDVAGVEIGNASAAYARDQLALRVHTGSLYEFAETGNYDAVSFLEVIEHLEQPAQALQRIHALLKKDGLLLLSTPNYDSLFRRLFGARWWVVNCEDEHIMFFTPRTLKKMLQDQGFEVLSLKIRSIDIMGILKNLRGHKPQPAAQETSEAQGYYESRSDKEWIKDRLRQTGLISLARGGMRLLDTLFSLRFSPFFGMGEQLVVIARRKG